MNDKVWADFRDEISIVLCGEAGQGVQTVEHILTRLAKLSGYHVFSGQEYMSRIRGGSNATLLRISSKRVSAFVDRIDLLVPFSPGSVNHVRDKISSSSVLLGERKIFGNEYRGDRAIDVPLSELARQAGGPLYLNIVAVGLISGLLALDRELLDRNLRLYFSSKDSPTIDRNIDAARKGYAAAQDLLKTGRLRITLQKNEQIQNEILIDGAEALAMGAVAGGCNFIPFYPMSPSTGVATFLAQRAKDFGIIVEQAEDEISAMNMAIGAWYAGARAMASTSGGGFALMVEGVSLAGMLESPLVVHIGQRPGPATGLPTRTEQGDLLFVLHAGHGEFPRAIFTPGTIEEAFDLTQRAFNLADRYQVPVFVLTDQYLLESHYNIPSLDPYRTSVERFITETAPDYKRYRLTENGISPRGIPGFGKGRVVLDSDEHDEEGHITEDLALRTRMVQKRLRKLDAMKGEALPPEWIGSPSYKTLVIGWGSNYGVIREAMERLEKPEVAFLHLKQVYPLHPDTASSLRKAERVILVENNATSQLGSLIQLQTGFEIKKKILKYNGLPFSVEELEAGLRASLDQEV
jgi:2-oxoglutarate ferredoxin oxidoreductase subunit alpha